jgi:hypothetical protein
MVGEVEVEKRAHREKRERRRDEGRGERKGKEGEECWWRALAVRARGRRGEWSGDGREWRRD